MVRLSVILDLRSIDFRFIKLKNKYKNHKSLKINELMTLKICYKKGWVK